MGLHLREVCPRTSSKAECFDSECRGSVTTTEQTSDGTTQSTKTASISYAEFAIQLTNKPTSPVVLLHSGPSVAATPPPVANHRPSSSFSCLSFSSFWVMGNHPATGVHHPHRPSSFSFSSSCLWCQASLPGFSRLAGWTMTEQMATMC